MKLSFVLNLVSAASAFIAAFFWFRSSVGKPPTMGSYFDAVPETDPYRIYVVKSVKMNRWAALFAGLSALTMGVALVLPPGF